MATVVTNNLPSGVAQLSHISECAVCHDVYKDPRMLPCLHSFCFDCLCSKAEGLHIGDCMACPMCRKTFVIPEEGLHGLQKNFYMSKLAEFHTLTYRSRMESRARCTICGSKPLRRSPNGRANQTEEDDEDETASSSGFVHRWATKYCLDCRQEMCTKCSILHRKMMISKNHSIVELGSRMSMEKLRSGASYCGKHEDELLKMYCYQCQKLLCLTCYAEEHSRHRCDNIKTAATHFQNQATSDLEKIRVRRLECHNALDVADSERKRYQAEVDKCMTEIRRVAEELKMRIDMDKASLVKSISEARDTSLKLINELRIDLEQRIDAMDGYELFTREVFDKGSPTDIASISKDLHLRAAELLSGCKSPPIIIQVPTIQTRGSPIGNQVGMFGTVKRYIYRQLRTIDACKTTSKSSDDTNINLPYLGVVLGIVLIPVAAVLLLRMLYQ